MNKRIRELAKQATEDVIRNTPSFLVTNEMWQNKFADLIIGECLDILEDEDTHDIYGQPIRLATIRIKKQFGVGE